MTASFAPSAAPANAPRIWGDRRNIYLEFASAIGPPYIIAFARSGGMNKILALVAPSDTESGPPLTKRPLYENLTAKSILKSLGVIG